jgi:hypothetical protein
LTMGFRLSQSLRLSRSLFTNSSSFHDGILAIRKPFTRTFSFFTMEFWLSGSLSHKLFFLFSRWNSGYQEAFHTNFFFFHDEILAIMKPFTRTFLFFTRWNLGYHKASSRIFLSQWNLGYHEAFHTNFSFFCTMESRLSRSLFTNFSFTMESRLSRSPSHDGIHKMHDLGEDSFHIYHKEYLHRIRLIKNLAS